MPNESRQADLPNAGMTLRRCAAAAILAAPIFAGTPASAQTAGQLPGAAQQPIVVVLPNYNTIPVGEIGSLEAGAYLARVQDSSATWFNPAGLARAERSSVSGSAGAYSIVSLAPESIEGRGGSFHQMPAAVGVVIKNLLGRERWTGGVQVTVTGNWDANTDVEFVRSVSGTTERVAYSSGASFGGLIASVAAGYDSSPKLRLGASFDVQLTEWESGASLGDQYQTPAGLTALFIEGHGSASATHLRLTAGVQYDPKPAFRLGAMLRTPGLGLWASGSRFHEGLSTSGAAKVTSSFFEPDADIAFKIPLELKLGAAYVGRRAQVEFDLMVHGGSGQYEAFRPTQPLVVLTDPGLGGAPTRREFQPNPAVVDSESLVNVAVGGQYTLTENGRWKVHGGFATDRSPVGPSDTVFTKVDMRAWTIGLSGGTGVVLGSLGLRYESGMSDPLTLRRLENGEVYTTRLEVRNVGIVYSFAFRF